MKQLFGSVDGQPKLVILDEAAAAERVRGCVWTSREIKSVEV